MSSVNSSAEYRVLEVIREVVPGVEPSALLDTLPIDSLEFLALLQTLEQRFEIVVSDEKLQELHSVEDLIKAFAR